ncbi:MAG: membrane protein insertion efficiency factor YidD [Pseudomonadota bacterium]
MKVKGPVAALALGALWVYKHTLSPAFMALGVRCRHWPTCSDYAVDAFRAHDPWTAFWLTFSRLMRCHPFGSSGVDPAPLGPRGRWWEIWRLGDWSWRERSGDDQSSRENDSEKPPSSPSSSKTISACNAPSDGVK